MTKMTKKKAYVESSGNIFRDLGFDDVEAQILETRSTLMVDIAKTIAKRGLNQAEAAKILGVTQSRVSDLVRGKFAKFSLEMLITLEGRLGRRVTVKLAA